MNLDPDTREALAALSQDMREAHDHIQAILHAAGVRADPTSPVNFSAIHQEARVHLLVAVTLLRAMGHNEVETHDFTNIAIRAAEVYVKSLVVPAS